MWRHFSVIPWEHKNRSIYRPALLSLIHKKWCRIAFCSAIFVDYTNTVIHGHVFFHRRWKCKHTPHTHKLPACLRDQWSWMPLWGRSYALLIDQNNINSLMETLLLARLRAACEKYARNHPQRCFCQLKSHCLLSITLRCWVNTKSLCSRWDPTFITWFRPWGWGSDEASEGLGEYIWAELRACVRIAKSRRGR